MRIFIDSLIALMLVAVAVGVVTLNQDRKQGERDIETVQKALDRLQEQAAYHTAVKSAMVGHDTLLVHLEKGWFGDELPTNALLEDEHPWLDLAPPGDLGSHPPDPVATRPDQAGFWYNPTTGVFRARVTPGASEAQTVALYNRVNGTALSEFELIPDPERQPIAHNTNNTPARLYASMANLTWTEPKPKHEEETERAFAPLLDPEHEQAIVRDQPATATDNAVEPGVEQDDPNAEADAPGNESTDAPAQPEAESAPHRPKLQK